jgi:ribosomal protein S18 acetylase RimI-like enzyme
LSFRYFAYGWNMWPPQIRSRCPSARLVETASIPGWAPVYDKPSTDGSAKLNIRPIPGAFTNGVVYEIDDSERQALDEAEPRYRATLVNISGRETLTYAYEGEPTRAMPYDWYVATVIAGARRHEIPVDGLEVDTVPDPIAAEVRPATEEDLSSMQAVLSDGLAFGGERYYVHPGDLAWWMYHADPRATGRVSYWMQGQDGFAVIDSSDPSEISAFTRPGRPLMPLVRWSQRRLGDRGELGWVSDDDEDLVANLTIEGLGPVSTYRSYEWDLDGKPIPEPAIPDGWALRHVRDESEADSRRSASHAAFESTMDPSTHLDRYLEFMRSPIYDPERDLIAVAPDGTIVSFMIWWPDASGIAQIEPFGTHPDFQRGGAGRALIHYGLRRMRIGGMRLARVCTDDDRLATAFYESVGFDDVGRLRWWARV